MNEREPDKELADLLRELEAQATDQFRHGFFGKSFDLYKKMLTVIFEAQSEQKRPIHKGLPLHMMGVLYKIQNKDNEALLHFLLAYIENTLRESIGKEYKADYAPAYYNIVYGFAFDPKILKQIKSISKEKSIKIFRPGEIFKELGLESDKLLRYTTLEKCVFVGGDYLLNSENITIVEQHIKDLGFLPVITYYLSRDPNDFSRLIIPKNMDYKFSLSLLNKCKKAIFSVVHGGGHYFEIAECKKLGINPLLIVHKFYGEENKIEKLSGMVKTIGFDIKDYTDPFNELKKLIKIYLS